MKTFAGSSEQSAAGLATAGAKRREWQGFWPLPFVAMLGITGAATQGYASGVFMEQMTREFGWTRAEFSSAFTLQMVVGLIAMPLAGRLADRIGVRRVALMGIPPFMIALSALGLANGYIWQWWLLSLLSAVMGACVTPPIWIKAVVRTFHASRGLAMSIALAGQGLASAVWPIVAALYVGALGWRLSYPALALTWGIPMAILTWFFFRERAQADARSPGQARGAAPVTEPLAPLSPFNRRALACILIAGGIFSCTSYGVAVHFVPIMRQNGLTLATAAGLAGLAGFFSTGGRIVIGYLLDHLPTRLMGFIVFLLPIGVASLLWMSSAGFGYAVAAAVLYGLGNGAETDVVAYLMARRFGHARFASIYAIFASVIAACASTGPLLAGAIYDVSGGYGWFFVAMVLLSLTATTVISFVLKE